MGRSGATPARQLAGFIDRFTPALARDYRAALTRMRRFLPGSVQLVYDNWNGLVTGFGPNDRPSDAVVSLLLTADHITLCFIQNGPDLPDPERLLKGSGKVVRHVRLSAARDLDNPAIRTLVNAARAMSDVPFEPRKRSTLVIRAISPKQRPRRPVPPKRRLASGHTAAR